MLSRAALGDAASPFVVNDLSTRLDTILQMLGPCQVLADVGTDHGQLPIAAVQRGIASTAIAADLREPPLVLARKNIAHAQLKDRVIAVRADGLLPLQRYAPDAVVIAGMSARLMIEMCEAAPEVLTGVAQLVVQPNRDLAVMRAWARDNGWHLRDERILYERARSFTTCSFAPGVGSDPAYDVGALTASILCEAGPLLLARRDPNALRWYQAQRAYFESMVSSGAPKLQPELETWRRVCDASI